MFDLKNYLLAALLVAGTAMGSTGASAATVIGTLQSVGTGSSLTLHAVRPNGTTIGQQVLNGMSVLSRSGGTDTSTLAGGTGTFFAFCVEPYEDAALNATYTYTMDPLASAAKSSVTGGIGATKATQIGELFGQYAPNLAAPMTNVQASALQVAIWEIVSEASTNPFDVFAGTTYFSTPGTSDTNDVLALAQSYLNYVTAANGNGVQAQGLRALTVGGNQDMLVQVSTAPEPGTWLMMIMGFGLIGSAMRTHGNRGRSRATVAA